MKKRWILSIALVLLVLPLINAAEVSHPADQITNGTFNAGDYIFQGNVQFKRGNESFLKIGNTELNGKTWALVSAGSLGGIGIGKFAIYDVISDVARFVINPHGNVGINTTEPNATLHVRGNIFSSLDICTNASPSGLKCLSTAGAGGGGSGTTTYFQPDTGGTLANNLISYWKMDETSGIRQDSKGLNALSDFNTVTSNPGKVGTAAQFTAANVEMLTLADNPSISTGDIDWTFSAWVLLDTTSTGQYIITKNDGATFEYVIMYDSGPFRFLYYDGVGGTSGDVSVSAGPISAGAWYFVIAYHNAATNQIGISVNNGPFSTVSTSSNPQDTSTTFRIGGRASGANSMWDGRIDEVGFWKRVLTAQEITDLYNSGNGNTYNPAGYSSSQWTTSGSDIYYNLGNVGIGTTNPLSGRSLHVDSSVGTTVRISGSDSTGAASIELMQGTKRYVLQTLGQNHASLPNVFRIYDDIVGATRLLIDTNGNVGIGTTGPAAKLDVAGTIAMNGINFLSDGTAGAIHHLWTGSGAGGTLRVTNNAGSADLVTIQNSGKVGIGTTGPTSRVDVVGGDVRVRSGSGFIAQSPDGLTCKRIGIDNTGAIIATAVPCP